MDPREDLIRHYRWLRRYGLNDSHSGNASVRRERTVWVTPSGACADTLAGEELLACDMDGECPAGASLDGALHLAVYRACADAGALLHSHGPYTVAMTLDGRDFQPPDFEGQYYFARIPVLDIPYRAYLTEAPERVAAALIENRVAIVRGHGVYARAETLNLAYKWTCSLELSAKTAFLAGQAGTLRAD